MFYHYQFKSMCIGLFKMTSVRYYGLSYNNPERKQRLKEQFAKENLHIDIYDGVPFTDPRINSVSTRINKKAWSCMWGHLDMLKQFLETDALYGIFCEDDILLRKGFAKFIPEVISVFNRFNLDIMLLSYLFPTKPIQIKNDLPLLEEPITYFRYYNNVWGTQMYMLSRTIAKKFIEVYTLNYAIQSTKDSSLNPFCADMILTKNGNRALIYPMLAIEEVNIDKAENDQEKFHKKCYDTHKHKRYYFLETKV